MSFLDTCFDRAEVFPPSSHSISAAKGKGYHKGLAFVQLAWISLNKDLKINYDSLVQNIHFLLHLLLLSFTLQAFKS